MKKSSTRIHITAESPGYGGCSVGRIKDPHTKGKVVLIKGALPGETVEAIIEEEKKDYSVASATSILSPSPERVDPSCPYFGICGGCHLQYSSYKEQLRLKQEILKDSLRRIAKIEAPLAEPLFHPDPWHYRFRGQFKVAHSAVGFFKEKTNEVVDIEACPLMRTEINCTLQEIKKKFSPMPLKELHLSFGDGVIALLKPSAQEAETSVHALASALIESGIKGVSIEAQGKERAYGEPSILLDAHGLRYRISAGSFFQSHWALNQLLVKSLCEYVRTVSPRRVVDLYSGAGNLSLPIATIVEEVVAIEENPHAVKDGRKNAEMNEIHNCRFIAAPAERAFLDKGIDLLMIDPPRLGVSNKVMQCILEASPHHIIYLSCNPSTLARDLRKLSPDYTIESVRMVDFFPQTYHIESLAFLQRRQKT